MVDELKGKKILVVGLARSGVGAANLLASLGADVIVNDIKGEDELSMFIKDLHPAVRLELGKHAEKIFLRSDMIVLSPGVPLALKPLSEAIKNGIHVIGELELAYIAVNRWFSSLNNKLRFLAVTGTNGKSTTASLLDFTMRKGKFKTIFGGNIGNSLTGELMRLVNDGSFRDIDFVVAEVSSFQLETIERFKPVGAVITNITPDHMDRYHSMKEYIDAKARIFQNQREGDFLILNADDEILDDLYRSRISGKSSDVPEVFFFSRKRGVKGVYLENGYICTDFGNRLDLLKGSFIKVEDIKIKGVHNLENAMAVIAMALLAGCDMDAVLMSLKEFKGLEHRVEFVREVNGVKFFNDSKGTNVAAVIKSVESFREPIILIAGGRDKEGDFRALRDVVRGRVKAMVLIGEAKGKIKDALKDVTEIIEAVDLKEAVLISYKIANKGDVVLLSPACASFDMFRNFEDRGEQFKKHVLELNNG